MENYYKISVVVPVYNSYVYLKESVRCILNQTFKNIEVILVDDGSTDGSGKICDEFSRLDKRVRVIHKKNEGAATARNIGIDNAEGKYIIFLDSDDIFYENFLEKLYLKAEEKCADIVYCAYRVEDKIDNKIIESKGFFLNGVDKNINFAGNSCYINMTTPAPWNKLYLLDFIKRNKLYFQNLRSCNDISFFKKSIIVARRIYYIDDVLLCYRMNGQSTTSKRHMHAENTLYANDDVLQFIYSNNKEEYLPDFYKGVLSNCKYEYERITNKVKAGYFRRQAYNFFPEEYHTSLKDFLGENLEKQVSVFAFLLSSNVSLLKETLKSIFNQSLIPDNIVLCVNSKFDNSNNNVEKELKDFNEKGLEIKYVSGYEGFLDFVQEYNKEVVKIVINNSHIYEHSWLYFWVSICLNSPHAFIKYNLSETNEGTLLQDFSILITDRDGLSHVLKPKKIIVSMTSYPARISGVSQVVKSICNQSRCPDKVILWLSDSQFEKREADLPKDLLEQVNKNKLTIRWCEDLKPHKKYFFAFQEYPDSLVITIDDDVLYPYEMIENLYQSYLKYPTAVSAIRAHLMVASERGEILPYKLWPKEIDKYDTPSMQLCATGVAGILYPTHLFSKVKDIIFDTDVINKTCLFADDLWLKSMELLAGVPVVVVEGNKKIDYLPGSQEVGLWHDNLEKDENDKQLKLIKSEIDKRYGDGFFIQRLTKTNIGENLSSIESLCHQLQDANNINRQLSTRLSNYRGKLRVREKEFNDLKKSYLKYRTIRLDIRNKGKGNNDIVVEEIMPKPTRVERPNWLSNGVLIESSAENMVVNLSVKGDGELNVIIRGRDVRNLYNQRYPVWVECSYFAVNGEIIFDEAKLLCHDKFYSYKKQVRDGDVIKIIIKWHEKSSSHFFDELAEFETKQKFYQIQAELRASKNDLKKSIEFSKNLHFDLIKIKDDFEIALRKNKKIENDLNEYKNIHFDIYDYFKYKFLSNICFGSKGEKYRLKYNLINKLYKKIKNSG